MKTFPPIFPICRFSLTWSRSCSHEDMDLKAGIASTISIACSTTVRRRRELLHCSTCPSFHRSRTRGVARTINRYRSRTHCSLPGVNRMVSKATLAPWRIVPIGDVSWYAHCAFVLSCPILWNEMDTFGTKEYNCTTCLRLTYERLFWISRWICLKLKVINIQHVKSTICFFFWDICKMKKWTIYKGAIHRSFNSFSTH